MIKGVVFDLDGTLYYGDHLAKDALEVIDALSAAGLQIFYFTNNSTKTRMEITDKLQRLGVPARPEVVYSSASTSCDYLVKKALKTAYVIGSESLKKEVEHSGISLVSPEEAECVLVGMDFDFSYEKIADALTAIEKGAFFVGCNVDANFLIENNVSRPGCGAMVGAIEGTVRHRADVIVGKPESNMIDQLMHEWGLKAEELFTVGDTYESDIVMAQNCGIHYAHLINSRKGSCELMEPHQVASLTEAKNRILEML